MNKAAPTSEQVAAEIAHLRDVQHRVPSHSAFGDNNREAIYVQIKVLEDRMSLDDVHLCFGALSESSEYALDAALQAHDWLTGKQAGDELSPAAGWEVIAK